MKVKREYLDYLYLGFFILVVFLFFTGILISAIGFSMVVIDNPDPNSMWPTYFQGDLFVLEDANPDDIVLGDVIVYENSSGDKIIHRVIDVVIINNQYFFRVKGDNPISNSTPDPSTNLTTLIASDSVLGKIVYRIPYLGHISLAMQRNAAIQLFVYLIVGLIMIAIVYWPEDEEEE
ncbi:MAG: signal peptidase I, partial [Candidatus Heimdallarchaeota archaeon]|nr:signal peptidase I [Candidatus Heimdallarchaeota archaeon]